MPTKTDIYAIELLDKHHSMRYIHITTRNVVGILNRIASLMRRKRYNMEEVCLTFDNKNRAHFVVAVDGRLIDVQQLIHLLQKLHDVFDAYDATFKKDRLHNAFYVEGKTVAEFDKFPMNPVRVLCEEAVCTGIFMLNLDDTPRFLNYLQEKGYHDYQHRLLSLI